MQNKKSMSQTIKSVSDAVESVLGYQPSATQVVQTIEAIEVLVGGNKQVAVQTERKTFIVKPKATKPKAKKIIGYNSWKRYNAWFDSILDGDVHVLTYSHLKNQVPSATRINRSSWRNRLRTEAMNRGYASASVMFNDKHGHITIQAVR